MRTLLSALIILVLSAQGWAVSPEVRDELNRGRILEKGGNQADALAVYEKVFSEHPEYQPAFSSLRSAYMKAGMYDQLIDACAVALKIRPKDTSTYMALGEAWAAKGEREKAKQAWEEIVNLNPNNRGHYNLAAYEFSRHEMHEDAIRVYQRGESVVGEHTFARELARTYERMGEFASSAEEVLNILKTNPKDALTVERELKRLISRSSSPLIVGVVKSRASREPENPVIHRVLGDLHLLEGEYDQALREYSLSDAEDPVWELGLKAEKEGLYEAALSSYRSLADKKGKHATAAKFKIGAVLEARREYEPAVEAYKEYIRQFPTDSQEALARYRIGMVRLDGLGDLKGALNQFKELARSDVERELLLDSRYMVAECNLRLGSTEEAAGDLRELIEESPSDRSLYLLGEVVYYQGDFDSSLALARRVATEFPQSDLVNDALSRSVFISANKSDPKMLHRFASVERMFYSGEFDGAAQELRHFLNEEANSDLADDAMILLGDVLEARGDYNEAIGAYRDVLSLFPESKLHAEARRRIGELFAVRLNDRSRAIEELEQILLNHPDYVLTATVRNRVDELKKGYQE